MGCVQFIWGLVLIGTGFARNFETLIALRVLLGVLEAPIVPGNLLIVGMWYSRRSVVRKYLKTLMSVDMLIKKQRTTASNRPHVHRPQCVIYWPNRICHWVHRRLGQMEIFLLDHWRHDLRLVYHSSRFPT